MDKSNNNVIEILKQRRSGLREFEIQIDENSSGQKASIERAVSQIIFKASSKIVYERALSRIIEVWERFSKINRFNSSFREDVEMVKAEGMVAIYHLLPVALNDTNQSPKIARFLLNLYNGSIFPFDMTLLREIDHGLLMDCLTVLMMESTQGLAIHNHVVGRQEVWEHMARDQGFIDKVNE